MLKLPALLLLACLAVPSTASADVVEEDFTILIAATTLDMASSIASLVTAIGSGLRLQSDRTPSAGWAIASFVTGGPAITFASVMVGLGIRDSDPVNGVYVAITIAAFVSGALSIGLGIANLVKRKAQLEVEEQWVVAPIMLDARDGRAPGLAAGIGF